MTTDLRDELARIAGDVTAAPAPPDLWRRGVRRRRRARVGTALAAAASVLAVVAVGALGRDLLARPPAQPADRDGPGAIPSRLYTPSRWLDGTGDQPPGRVAALAGAERADGWWGATEGVVAIAAASGEYRFLELPDAFDDPAEDFLPDTYPALSPDGRRVAYWTAQPQHRNRLGGVAVYDTVTGEVLRHELPSELGVAPELLEWGGQQDLVVGYGVVTERREDGLSFSSATPFLWRSVTDRVVDLDQEVGAPDAVSPTVDGFVLTRTRHLELRSGAAADVDRVVRLRGRHGATQSTVDPAAGRVVMLPQSRDGAGVVRRLLVGNLETEQVRLEPRPVAIEVLGLLGWQDSQHVVVRGIVPGTGRGRAAAYAVDLRTGGLRLLVREQRISYGMFPVYAGELWPHPTVARPAPVGHDPRLPAGAAAAAALATAGALTVARRRRRAG